MREVVKGQEAYPPYCAVSGRPAMLACRFSATTGACLRMAAPVLEFGDDPASPRAKTLSNRLCRSVFLSIWTYPAGFSGSAMGLALIQSGADWRGTTWSRS